MDLITIREEIYRVSKRLDKIPQAIIDAAREQASAEEAYEIAAMQETIRLKEEGFPATLIDKVVKGILAQHGLRRDLNIADGKLKAAVKGADVLQSEMSGLQSILRTQEEI